ncbi:MAG TPA: formate dehydrogenase subunit delta [Rhodopila sp.]|uniref:formate dehydrogenase subunit delta n=1 Tax=Rhodopila sp. TaxID=2480087 RepID=UPI002D11CB4F|nr:formate dehydrogenase subunit delta [Rhodopila sp.]HVY17023.1 formate dehydrogenase subunit delta [Rhodopila sp.]
MSPEKLAYMANQIGRFFASQKSQEAVDGIADHLIKFWDPRMRRTIVSHLDDGTMQLDPLVRQAVERLRTP